MICPLVAVGLATGAIILFEVVIAISAVCVIPFETKGRELSDRVDHAPDSQQVVAVVRRHVWLLAHFEATIMNQPAESSVRMHDQNHPVYTLDEALASVGFGKFQALLLAYAGLGWFAEAMEVMILSFVGPAVKSEWNLSPGQESLLTTAVFSGMLVGAYSWGLGLLGMTLLSSGAGFLSPFSPNYASLVILRCFVGIGLGGATVFSSWFVEFVPASNRGTRMVLLSMFWAFGTIFESALAWVLSSISSLL
ncbi:unnamed protein product [Dovyalis caffra]|uniref:Major facilitator superfamily (MFS) profile domain-containing protein n=1 Tax=Dovyalis caffra TaxID=77055 RepID=A0AAV1S6J1_9ROSI|nr:unnamed protein product [Dovyalis caffra]